MARAFGWQSKGHRFDSDILHINHQSLIGGFLVQLRHNLIFSLFFNESWTVRDNYLFHKDLLIVSFINIILCFFARIRTFFE